MSLFHFQVGCGSIVTPLMDSKQRVRKHAASAVSRPVRSRVASTSARLLSLACTIAVFYSISADLVLAEIGTAGTNLPAVDQLSDGLVSGGASAQQTPQTNTLSLPIAKMPAEAM